MAEARAYLPVRRFLETTRRDAWWRESLVTFVVFVGFIVYSTWAGYQNANYEYGPYLSPMYSPLLFGPSSHSWFGGPAIPTWWPPFLHYSAAALILVFPLSFRLTCYYYRGAYYKAFWADPVSCAVGEPRKKYLGERSFPLVMQNIHRYALYFALIFIVILAIDAWKAMWFPIGTNVMTAGAPTEFGIGVGHDHPDGQRRVHRALHVRLPFAPPSGRWPARRPLGATGQPDRLQVRQLPEPLAHELGLDEPGVGRVH